ncbi:hypothetical protein MJH12_00235 [bacterium]|nr:hypothetical protein [bacterium]
MFKKFAISTLISISLIIPVIATPNMDGVQGEITNTPVIDTSQNTEQLDRSTITNIFYKTEVEILPKSNNFYDHDRVAQIKLERNKLSKTIKELISNSQSMRRKGKAHLAKAKTTEDKAKQAKNKHEDLVLLNKQKINTNKEIIQMVEDKLYGLRLNINSTIRQVPPAQDNLESLQRELEDLKIPGNGSDIKPGYKDSDVKPGYKGSENSYDSTWEQYKTRKRQLERQIRFATTQLDNIEQAVITRKSEYTEALDEIEARSNNIDQSAQFLRKSKRSFVTLNENIQSAEAGVSSAQQFAASQFKSADEIDEKVTRFKVKFQKLSDEFNSIKKKVLSKIQSIYADVEGFNNFFSGVYNVSFDRNGEIEKIALQFNNQKYTPSLGGLSDFVEDGYQTEVKKRERILASTEDRLTSKEALRQNAENNVTRLNQESGAYDQAYEKLGWWAKIRASLGVGSDEIKKIKATSKAAKKGIDGAKTTLSTLTLNVQSLTITKNSASQMLGKAQGTQKLLNSVNKDQFDEATKNILKL